MFRSQTSQHNWRPWHFLAAAIENADEERSDAWCLRDTGKGLRLMTGRLFAFRGRPLEKCA